MLALAVRQASRNRSIEIATKSGIPSWNEAAVRELAQEIKSPVFIATPYSTRIDDLAEVKYRASASQIAEFGSAIASIIDNTVPLPENFDRHLIDTVQKIASTLTGAHNPVIITGIQINDSEILHAAANIANALSLKGKKPSLSIVFPECNSLGLGLMDGNPLDALIEKVSKGDVETLIILENDLYKRAEKEKVDLILSKCRNIIVLDYQMNETAKQADILLPSGTYAESTGTIINNEGRAQRYYRALPAEGNIKDNWKFLSEMIEISGNNKYGRWGAF